MRPYAVLEQNLHQWLMPMAMKGRLRPSLHCQQLLYAMAVGLTCNARVLGFGSAPARAQPVLVIAHHWTLQMVSFGQALILE